MTNVVAMIILTGIFHQGAIVDCLYSFEEGRINPNPRPVVERPFPAFLLSNADESIAKLGFDQAVVDIANAAKQFGIALYTQKNSYSTGELGYYVRRLAEQGVISLAEANADLALAASAGGPRVYGTNPMAFGYPLGPGVSPVVIDQASGATALVNIIAAA